MRRSNIDFRKNKNHCKQIIRNLWRILSVIADPYWDMRINTVISLLKSVLSWIFLFASNVVSIKDADGYNLIIKIESVMEGTKSLAREWKSFRFDCCHNEVMTTWIYVDKDPCTGDIFTIGSNESGQISTTSEKI